MTYGDGTHVEAKYIGTSRLTLCETAAAAGKRVEVRGCKYRQFRDGKFVKKDRYWKIMEPSDRG